MSKNIVICCDGTGNEYGDNNSNVVTLFSALVLDETRQVGYYHPGVGTEGSPTSRNKAEALFSISAGLAIGTGILQYVGDSYRYLMNVYEEGDQIYLFGFSRGAYTVRALAGMVNMYGLLRAGNEGLIPYILKMFSRKARMAGGMTPSFAEAVGFKKTFSRNVKLHVVGVWDTVSSVGMVWDPLKLPYTAVNPSMVHGLHALSIDERRSFFRNNLWGAPLPKTIDGEQQTIKQVWFAGVHSDVGGSYPALESGLSQITLEWMLGEAVKLGLLVDPHRAERVLGRIPPQPPVPPNPAQLIHNSLTGAWWLLEWYPRRVYDWTTKKKRWAMPFGSRRQIPEGSTNSPECVEKMRIDPTYKPKNLPEGWQRCIEAEHTPFFSSEISESGLCDSSSGESYQSGTPAAVREIKRVGRPDPKRLAYQLNEEKDKIRFVNIGTLSVAALAALIFFSFPFIVGHVIRFFHLSNISPHISWRIVGPVLLVPTSLLIVFSILSALLKASLKKRLVQTLGHVENTVVKHDDK